MELHEIEILIEKDGRVRIFVQGVKGEACLELTKELEQALGSQIELREMTPEALESIQEKVRQHISQKQG